MVRDFFGIQRLHLKVFSSYLLDQKKCFVSVLGPSLFIMSINDLYYHFLPDIGLLYADDPSLVCSPNQNEILVEKWLINLNWMMTMQSLTISSNLHIQKGKHVTVDDGLRWDYYIEELCRKLSDLFVLRRLRNLVDSDSLRTVFILIISVTLNIWAQQPFCATKINSPYNFKCWLQITALSFQ